jgi:hypothetical protein
MMAKQRRFEWRCRIPVSPTQEVKRIGVNWEGLVSALALTRLLSLKLKCRVANKAKANATLGNFVICVRAIGKFKIMLSKIKVKRAMKTMRCMIGPVSYWVKKRRVNLGKIIVTCVETALTSDMMFKLMVGWTAKVSPRQILMIQRNCSNFLAVKRTRNEVLQTKWRLIEANVHKKKIKAQRKVKKNEPVPDAVMKHYTELFYKESLKGYLTAKAEHAAACAEVDSANQMRSYELSINLVGTSPLPKPCAPCFKLFSNQLLFKSFIVKSRDDTASWATLVRSERRQAVIGRRLSHLNAEEG